MAALSIRGPWLVALRGLLRAAAIAAILVAAYFLLPLSRLSTANLLLALVLGMALLAGMIAWYVRVILRSKFPGIRATEALAATTPLFLLLFASMYFILSRDDPGTFSEQLSLSDALYFTITIFSTVGFGDITPQVETARLVVAVQMLLDLLVLGLGIQVIVGAPRRGRATQVAGEGGTRDGGETTSR